MPRIPALTTNRPDSVAPAPATFWSVVALVSVEHFGQVIVGPFLGLRVRATLRRGRLPG